MATRFGRARGCHRRFWQLDFRLFLAILVFPTSLKLLELVHRVSWNCNHLSSYSQYSTWFLNLAILAERHPEIHRWRSQPTLLRRYRPLERWLFFIIQRKKRTFVKPLLFESSFAFGFYQIAGDLFISIFLLRIFWIFVILKEKLSFWKIRKRER